MKKKLLFIFVLAFMLTGCNQKQVESVQDSKSTSMFCEVESAGPWRVVYHRDTKVMYVVSSGGYSTGVFTLMVDADGKPLLYEGDN